jgi:DNA-directed RNA polymerase specialized sigma24 family protein
MLLVFANLLVHYAEMIGFPLACFAACKLYQPQQEYCPQNRRIGRVSADFAEEWAVVDAAVRRRCLRSLRDHDLADEIVQRTRIRAWRGYGTFQRKSSFLTWVLTIATREMAREMAARARYVDLDSIPEPIAPEQEKSAPTPDMLAAVRSAIREALAAGEVSPTEVAVVRARLDAPDASWSVIGVAIGATANNCAVLFFRAIAKIRVFVFRFHADLLGGRANVERAFQAALVAAPERRLSLPEADAFRACILSKMATVPIRGQREDLRGACVKVALQLERY